MDDDDDDDDLDDITDVWDEEKLKAALGALRTDTTTAPATESRRGNEDSIEISPSMSPSGKGRSAEPDSKADTDPPPPLQGGGLSWPLTIVLAIVLAGAVYLLVSYLK